MGFGGVAEMIENGLLKEVPGCLICYASVNSQQTTG